MAAVAITQPLQGSRLRRLAVERAMTEVALAGPRARRRHPRIASSTHMAKRGSGRCPTPASARPHSSQQRRRGVSLLPSTEQGGPSL
jgi:hypothetical protein